MTATERRELKNVVNGRFKLLAEQIETRQVELSHALDTQLRAEHSEQVAHYAAEVKELDDKLGEIIAEYVQVRLRARDEGVRLAEPDLYYRARLLDTSPVPADYSERRREGERRLEREARTATNSLEAERLKLVEEIALDGLESEDARSFLTRVPDINDLLPAPDNAVAALVETNGDEG